MSSKEKSILRATPLSELEIDVSLVYSLLTEQHPDLRHLPINLVDAGWDNAMFRAGQQIICETPSSPSSS